MAAADTMDNVFIERLWRSLKYEAVYLHELSDDRAARRVIGQLDGVLQRAAAESGQAANDRADAGPTRRAV